MNILIIQENGHHEANRNFRECFCLKRGFEYHGAEVKIWGKGHSNFEQTPIWENYDLILAIENWDWMPDLKNIHVPKFIWAIDAHCKGPQIYEQYGFDKVLHATKQFAKDGCWLPNCYDDTIIKPHENQFYNRRDIGFCGNVVNRKSYLDYLTANLKGFIFDEMVIGDDMVKAINSYKIHWNANISVDINYRNFETMGCNTCLLTSAHPDYKELGIIHGKNCLIYEDAIQMINYAKYAIKNHAYREDISKSGYELVKNNHTYKNRAQTILEILDENR